jgi:hypothetical protein
MEARGNDLAAMLRAIDELDFERIKAKLMHRHGGTATPDDINRAEIGYRQFLKLAAKHPDFPVVPSEAVDEFWHMHILDTQRYAADCARIFGYFVHHDPYMGIDGPEDEVRLFEAAERSNALWAQEFGDAAVASAYCIRSTEAAASSAAYCIRSTKAASPSAAAYCIRSTINASSSAAYCIHSTKSEASSPTYCIRATEEGAIAAYCITAQPGADTSAAYCIRPLATSPAAYCIRPMTDASFAQS